MSYTNYRLLNRICYSKLFNSTTTSRMILSQKQCITTNSCKLNCKMSMFNPHQISNHNVLNQHCSFSFSSKPTANKKNDNEEFDSDSDLSDFSDFSDDSDDSDIEDGEINKTKQHVQSNDQPKKNDWKFGHADIAPDLIMKDRLIISNLNFSTNRNDLWELCENYGTVIDVHLPSNKNRDFHNRGFGFVTFEKDKDAQNALDNIAGIMFNSRQLRAGFARKDTEKPSVHNATSQKLRDRSDFQFAPNAQANRMNINENRSTQQLVQTNDMQQKSMNETVITVNGLPGNINLAQITKMFNEFGSITNITFSPYQMMGHSFMNAIVCVKLQQLQQMNNKELKEETQTLSFQQEKTKEINFKDRSVDKSDIGTVRRNMNKNVNHNSENNNKAKGIDADTLAKEIDELLADTDEDEDEDEDENNSDSESESSLSSSDSEENAEETQNEESSSDSEDDRIK